MRTKISRLLYIAMLASIVSAVPKTQPVLADYQEIKETRLISDYMDDNFKSIKKIYRYANEMKKQALPFNNKKHRDRYRFEPRDHYVRDILSVSRDLTNRFKVLKGILYHSSVHNRDIIFKETFETINTISVYSKRSIRAIKDNNYALYLASAEGIEKEAVTLNNLLMNWKKASTKILTLTIL